MKRPSFQFYPGDWLHDRALRACSLAARGLWADMLCFMHQGIPYGHLTLPGASDTQEDILRPILPPILARMVGASAEEVEALLRELASVGAYSVTAGGVIFSRRMVADEQLRETRAACGIQSLHNPNVPRPKRTGKDTPQVPLPPSPSSSSSSSNPSSPETKDSDVGVKTRKKKAPTEPGMRLMSLLKKGVLANNPDARISPKQEQQWAIEADRMMRRDGRTETQIAELIAWSQAEPYWRTNILSMANLRKHFDQLTVKRKYDIERHAGHGGHPALGQQQQSPTPYVPASVQIEREIEAERAAKTTTEGKA